MNEKLKSSIIFLLLGVIFGIVVTSIGGLVTYKILKATQHTNMGGKLARKMDQLMQVEDRRFDARKLLIEGKDGVTVMSASSLDRVFQDGKTLESPSFNTAVDLTLARNEFESFQILVATAYQELKDVVLNISPLVSVQTQETIAAKNIYYRIVGYVPTQKPYYPTKYVGLWPDPLLLAKPVSVEPGKLQPFWVSLYVPTETPAGEYEANISVMSQGQMIRELPLKVRVYDFVLPVESHLKTAFDFYGHETFRRYPQGKKEDDDAYQARLGKINDYFQIMMLKYRMNPVLNVDLNNQAQLGTVDLYRQFGLNNFSIGKRGGTLGNNWPNTDEGIESLLDEYRGYGELLKLHRLLDYQYIYTWDEGELGNPLVQKVSNMIHRAHPGLKNMVCYHGFWNPEEHPGWGDDIDIWCFQISNFNQRKMDALKAKGIEMWMYISGPSSDGAPNLALDFDSLDYRIVPWMCWKYDIKGFLYWCVNWWPKVDPFLDAKNTKWEQNGNGLLFYPGENGPLPSLRAEVFRDGMEDYEYIEQLMSRLRLSKHLSDDPAYQRFSSEAVKILTIDDQLIRQVFDFSKDATILLNRRNAIAEKIEEFDRVFRNK